MNDDDLRHEQRGQMQTSAIVTITGGLFLLVVVALALHFAIQFTGGWP